MHQRIRFVVPDCLIHLSPRIVHHLSRGPSLVIKRVEALLQFREALIKRELLFLEAFNDMCKVLVLRLLLLLLLDNLWALLDVMVAEGHVCTGLVMREL